MRLAKPDCSNASMRSLMDLVGTPKASAAATLVTGDMRARMVAQPRRRWWTLSALSRTPAGPVRYHLKFAAAFSRAASLSGIARPEAVTHLGKRAAMLAMYSCSVVVVTVGYSERDFIVHVAALGWGI